MGDVVALPLAGAVSLPDARGEHRALQVSWHERSKVFVVSVWRGGACVASVQLAPAEAGTLIGVLADGLAAGLTDGLVTGPVDGLAGSAHA